MGVLENYFQGNKKNNFEGNKNIIFRATTKFEGKKEIKTMFRATALLYGASAPDKTLGCIEFTFALDTC